MPEVNNKIEKIPVQTNVQEQEGGQEKAPDSARAFEKPAEQIPSEPKKNPVQPQTPSVGDDSLAKKAPLSLENIERALSSDLEDIYTQMTPDKQQEFKQKGEEAAREIKILLEKTKVNVKKITKIILNWLKIIPGVNKFFLEQESKIRTDEVLKLKG